MIINNSAGVKGREIQVKPMIKVIEKALEINPILEMVYDNLSSHYCIQLFINLKS